MDNKKGYCILIDSDNVSKKYIQGIFDEVAKYGSTPIRRLYGDLTLENKKGWKEICLSHSIKQVQSYNHTNGKNATDSSMIIDCMDILYTKDVDGFVIVSSDGDFTGLVQRLRESNKEVIGLGEKKTPEPFIKACTEFKYLENLISDSENSLEKTDDIEKKLSEIILNNGGEILLSQLKERIIKLYPDFDERTYGYQQFYRMLDDIKSFQLTKLEDKTTYVVSIVDNSSLKKAIDYAINLVKKSHNSQINISELNKKLSEKGMKYSKYGYSRFIKFLEGIPELTVENTNVIYKSKE